MKTIQQTKKEITISIGVHILLIACSIIPFISMNHDKKEALQVIYLDYTLESKIAIEESKERFIPKEIKKSANDKIINEVIPEKTKPPSQKQEVQEREVVKETPVIEPLEVEKQEEEQKVEEVITTETEIIAIDPAEESVQIEKEVVDVIEVEVIEEVMEKVEEVEAKGDDQATIDEVKTEVNEKEDASDTHLSNHDIEDTGMGQDLDINVLSEGEANEDSKTDDTGTGYTEGEGALGRAIVFRADPKLLAKQSGIAIVKVCISRKGLVSYAEYDIENSTILDKEIRALIMDHVLAYKFEKDYDAPMKECGTLSYFFDIK